MIFALVLLSSATFSITAASSADLLQFGYYGCYQDNSNEPLMYFQNGSPGSITSCITECENAGYRFVGLKGGGHCYCDMAIRPHPLQPDYQCNSNCWHDWNRMCGSSWTQSVFDRLSCASEPCQNGGTCVDMTLHTGEYKCSCASGWTGTTCDTYSARATNNACDANPCQNGATCYAVVPDDYVCYCTNGWGGDDCEISYDALGCYVDEVSDRKLTHQAPNSQSRTTQECIDYCRDEGYMYAGLEYSNECFCDHQIKSTTKSPDSECEMRCTGNWREVCGSPDRLTIYDTTDVCASMPCKNGGSCTMVQNSYTCRCAGGWTGTNCDIAPPTTTTTTTTTTGASGCGTGCAALPPCDATQYAVLRLTPAPGTGCAQFCQCAYQLGSSGTQQIYQWVTQDCGPGTLFDATIKVCNHAVLVTCNAGAVGSGSGCASGTTTTSTTTWAPVTGMTTPPVTGGTGCAALAPCDSAQYALQRYVPAPGTGCAQFCQCAYSAGPLTYEWVTKDCGVGTLFDASIQVCNHAVLVTCIEPSTYGPTTGTTTTAARTTTYHVTLPTVTGGGTGCAALAPCDSAQYALQRYIPAPGTGCAQFCQCAYSAGPLTYEWVTKDCGVGTLFDASIQVCNHAVLVTCIEPSTYGPTTGTTTTAARTTTYHVTLPTVTGGGTGCAALAPCDSAQYALQRYIPAPGTGCAQFCQCAYSAGPLTYEWVTKDCGVGTLFDASIQVCNHAVLVTCIEPSTYGPPTGGSTASTPITTYRVTIPTATAGTGCAVLAPCDSAQYALQRHIPAPGTGCAQFCQCAYSAGPLTYEWVTQSCGRGTLFDDSLNICNHAVLVTCSVITASPATTTTTGQQTTTVPATMWTTFPPGTLTPVTGMTGGGSGCAALAPCDSAKYALQQHIPAPGTGCAQFCQCAYSAGPLTYEWVTQSCGRGTLFDDSLNLCNHAVLVSCSATTTSPQTTTTPQATTTTTSTTTTPQPTTTTPQATTTTTSTTTTPQPTTTTHQATTTTTSTTTTPQPTTTTPQATTTTTSTTTTSTTTTPQPTTTTPQATTTTTSTTTTPQPTTTTPQPTTTTPQATTTTTSTTTTPQATTTTTSTTTTPQPTTTTPQATTTTTTPQTTTTTPQATTTTPQSTTTTTTTTTTPQTTTTTTTPQTTTTTTPGTTTTTTTAAPGSVVNGNWGAWTSLGCSKTCGSGDQIKTRSCDSPASSGGGSTCFGSGVDIVSCNLGACSGGSLNSGYVNRCPNGFMTCRSGSITCILEEFRCDCTSDCDDGSDENEDWGECNIRLCRYNGSNKLGSLTTLVISSLLWSLYQLI